jgi:hypothetical protein
LEGRQRLNLKDRIAKEEEEEEEYLVKNINYETPRYSVLLGLLFLPHILSSKHLSPHSLCEMK